MRFLKNVIMLVLCGLRGKRRLLLEKSEALA